MIICATVWGDEAKAIAKKLDLKEVNTYTDVNTKVQFRKASVEGRSKIVLTLDI